MAVLEIRTVAILGAGTMGSGIAQTCASAGFNVILMEVAQEPLTRGMAGDVLLGIALPAYFDRYEKPQP